MNPATFLPLMNAKIHKPSSLFDYNQVLYLSAEVNYTRAHFRNGSCQLMPYTIKHFEMYLTDNHDFVRIHRAFIVNRKYIQELSEVEVMMSSGKRLPVARRRKPFNSQIFDYHQKTI
jgi:DNA-binding LytR/AlgR family response regulator